jgi:hypothetical protein
MLAALLATYPGGKIQAVPACLPGLLHTQPHRNTPSTLDPRRRQAVLEHKAGNGTQAANYYSCDRIQLAYELNVAFRICMLSGPAIGIGICSAVGLPCEL